MSPRTVSESEESGWPTVEPLEEEAARAVLRDGDVEVLGRMPWSSNATFLVCLSLGTDQLLAIYKPQRGERPLWDFPRGTLCHREVAAREVSAHLGWDIVPDTVLRDGPVGLGMMQRFIHHDPEEHAARLADVPRQRDVDDPEQPDHEDEPRNQAARGEVVHLELRYWVSHPSILPPAAQDYRTEPGG